jgi:hypothetical protein
MATLAICGATKSIAATCPLTNIKSARVLHDLLSIRAVEVVQLASESGTGANVRLNEMVAPSAPFSLGSGDAIVRLGTGTEGARALAGQMSADRYRYLGYDYMDMPVDACSSQTISVEFVDTGGNSTSNVKFTFEGGKIVKAEGWRDSFESGLLRNAHPKH